jgi:hypothetical protein
MAYHVIGRNPRTWGIVIIALVVVLLILIIALIFNANRLRECRARQKGSMLGTNPLGNLNTGMNNPLWQYQLGEAGWGGPMHSTYQKGQSRVWGASAEGGHDMAVVPKAALHCNGADCPPSVPCAVSPAAVGEAQALTAVQALDPSGSAKNMSDDALMRVMSGGHA